MAVKWGKIKQNILLERMKFSVEFVLRAFANNFERDLGQGAQRECKTAHSLARFILWFIGIQFCVFHNRVVCSSNHSIIIFAQLSIIDIDMDELRMQFVSKTRVSRNTMLQGKLGIIRDILKS